MGRHWPDEIAERRRVKRAARARVRDEIGDEFAMVDVVDDESEFLERAGIPDGPCGRCGDHPTGYAQIGGVRFCHGNEARPTCYERESWDRAGEPT